MTIFKLIKQSILILNKNILLVLIVSPVTTCLSLAKDHTQKGTPNPVYLITSLIVVFMQCGICGLIWESFRGNGQEPRKTFFIYAGEYFFKVLFLLFVLGLAMVLLFLLISKLLVYPPQITPSILSIITWCVIFVVPYMFSKKASISISIKQGISFFFKHISEAFVFIPFLLLSGYLRKYSIWAPQISRNFIIIYSIYTICAYIDFFIYTLAISILIKTKEVNL